VACAAPCEVNVAVAAGTSVLVFLVTLAPVLLIAQISVILLLEDTPPVNATVIDTVPVPVMLY